MKLREINFTDQNGKVTNGVRGIEVLRANTTLETINKKPAAEFWREYDARPKSGPGSKRPDSG